MNPLIGYASIAAVTLVDRAHRVLRGADLAHHERLLRRQPHRAARGGTPRRSAASTCRRRACSASPGSCCCRARRPSGSPSATRPATSCCCCSWPRRCAARGAYTVPDFTQARLESPWPCGGSPRVLVHRHRLAVHRAAAAGRRPHGAASPPALPRWVGAVAVAVIVGVVVAAGGMRSITFVQAFQYWLKLTAVAAPVVFVLLLAAGRRAPPLEAIADAFPPFTRRRPEAVYRAVSLLRRPAARHPRPAARARAVLHEPRRPPPRAAPPLIVLVPAVGVLPVPRRDRHARPGRSCPSSPCRAIADALRAAAARRGAAVGLSREAAHRARHRRRVRRVPVHVVRARRLARRRGQPGAVRRLACAASGSPRSAP